MDFNQQMSTNMNEFSLSQYIDKKERKTIFMSVKYQAKSLIRVPAAFIETEFQGIHTLIIVWAHCFLFCRRLQLRFSFSLFQCVEFVRATMLQCWHSHFANRPRKKGEIQNMNIFMTRFSVCWMGVDVCGV